MSRSILTFTAPRQHALLLKQLAVREKLRVEDLLEEALASYLTEAGMFEQPSKQVYCIRLDGDTWYPRIVTVRVPNRCPVCGGPRGEPTRNSYCEDGDFYSVDNWENPCGHLDKYNAVYQEALVDGEVL